MYETEDTDWPEPEPEERFDWSLSFREMERKYSPSPIIPEKNKRPKNSFFWDKRNVDPAIKETVDVVVPKSSFGAFDAKFKRKFEYAHTLILSANPDILRWLFDNILTKKEWQT